MAAGRVVRWGRAGRLIHWTNLITVLTLIFTGLALFVEGTNVLASMVGGFLVSRTIHRVAAVVLIAAPLLAIILNWSAFTKWLRELVSWGKDDTAWAIRFPIYFFRPSAKMPPVHTKGTSGQRFLSWVLLFGIGVQIITGLTLWFRPFSKEVILIASTWHDIGFLLVAAPLLFHIYVGLGAFKPYRGVWTGMLGNGTVDEKLAEHLWPEWTAKNK